MAEPMNQDNLHEDRDDFPEYRDEEEIQPYELSEALTSLHLFDGDPYLRTQAFNLAIVDKFIMQLEYAALRGLNADERAPVADRLFLSAQSQMWIFAAYEMVRTWRERAKDITKWHDNGGLKLKIDALRRDVGFRHVARELRAEQLQKIFDDPSLVTRIQEDLRASHITFARLEYIRVALAKHEVGGRKKSIAYAPGYGRINKWCGSLEYELENNGVILGTLSRRDIADELRLLVDRTNLPTDEDLESFDASMKVSPPNPFLKEDD